MRTSLALRLRNSIDNTQIYRDSKYSVHVNTQDPVLSPRKSVDKTTIHQIYKITQPLQIKNKTIKFNRDVSGYNINYNSSVDVSMEELKKIKTLEKSLYYIQENRQMADNKIYIGKVLKEVLQILQLFFQNPIQNSSNLEKQPKRYSLPVLTKKQSPQHNNSDKIKVPMLPVIAENANANAKQNNFSIEKCLEDLNKIKSGGHKEHPKSTERILDLLLLNTCDLKKIFRNQNQKNKRKIIVQSKVPQDFFNILKNF
ncbi:unnamed protein product (macronuclear) [Paramecium tetraurelia]|uniref:Uncharacterized protein n=1 Tax=Paramecium tetraurelia TaxID=5888 RepID=A0DYA4_PARTE|nr:uncharacterized protein GSPATT00002989001 [Paramecium tetraurelia]CAK88021.1 unnamed protein product [Paramecium tetraurelia]|eukprot:XP_001455418.1 hypothetical protein (macronuclear) [Paramecium tetraurelia strain d4-2]